MKFPLKNPGILGINARNLLYIKPYNKDKAILIADDKIKTKAFLSARDIPVPKLYGIIDEIENLWKFDFKKLPDSFVLKPNLGYGGEGIIPIIDRDKDLWISIDNEKLTVKKLQNHVLDILDGRFSVINLSDKAFFEQLIIPDEILGSFSYKGLPDIRIIVHNLIPVMAMLRLPTRESRGKANLHQGAIGVGIDIAKGEATNAIHHNKIIDEIPEVGKIKGLKIPEWDKILTIACQAQLATNLGYLAADIAIDKTHGPILLEINARAGLSVQIANLAPLRKRLERIKGLRIRTVVKGIRIAKEMFGKAPEKNPGDITEKKIVGIEENVEVILKNQTKKVTAFLDTGIERSIVDENFALENKLMENDENYDDEKSTLKLKLTLAGKRIQSIFDVEKIKDEDYKIILGQRDLNENFLIDPSKKRKTKKAFEKITKGMDYKSVDDQLANIDNKIKLLYYLRPLNLEEEKKKFLQNFSYNPQFIYPELQYDPDELIDELSSIIFDDTPLGILFFKKSKELQKKINLHESRGEQSFTLNSIELFDKPSKEYLALAEQIIKSKKTSFEKETIEDVTAEAAKEIFSQVFKTYGLTHWKVEMKENLVTNCVAGKNNHLLLKKKTKFSAARIKSLIVHEIETHILTAENGKHQPYKLFNRGFAGYLSTQEGLALYNVKMQGLETDFDTLYKACLVKATELSLHMSFSELYLKLLDMGLSQNRAYRICIKLKRGLNDTSKPGGFTKDHIYFAGEKQVEQFIIEGGNILDLYLGKFNLQDLEYIKKIDGLQPPVILPKWIKL